MVHRRAMSIAPTTDGEPYGLGPLNGSAGALPLVVEPRAGGSRDAGALASRLEGRQAWARRALTEHGAFLFRGFSVDDPRAFERIARAITPELQNDYLGTSPRDRLTDYVFTASELPPYYPIPQHCEMSFLPRPPSHVFFWCDVAPSGPGGETPLVDVRRVLRDLSPAVRARFEARGVRIIRNYSGPEGGSRLDLWKLKRWDEMFQTTDRRAVERSCRENGFDFRWTHDGRLRLVSHQPAVRPHPATGEPVWFNHAQVFHLSSAAGEYRRIAARRRDPVDRWRYLALSGFARAAVFLKSRLKPTDDQAMHCTYGDGAPIPDEDMEAVRDAIWSNLVCFRWQKGDVVAIDNFAVAHGRMPYSGPRRVAVCWA
jgi:alpha-ketoglutarate-dependent taurine dioxygenase